MVIVNLQKTPKDRRAALVIRAPVDMVMAALMRALGAPIPPFVRTDVLRLSHELVEPEDSEGEGQGQGGGGGAPWAFRLQLASVHGDAAPLPMLAAVTATFPDCPSLPPVVLRFAPGVGVGGRALAIAAPRVPAGTRSVAVALTLTLAEAADAAFRTQQVSYVVAGPGQPAPAGASGAGGAVSVALTSQRTEYAEPQRALADALAAAAAAPPPPKGRKPAKGGKRKREAGA